MLYCCRATTFLVIITLISSNIVESSSVVRPNDGEEEESNSTKIGTRWAVLVAGSNGYINYRHQADVCHAYQILRSGGLKDENIIVFMYDDIAHNEENPTPGIIINKPAGKDVYAGVPKDYTGKATTAANLYAVLLGNKTALSGGSGKVLNSGPNDHIFVYYADHGSPGVLGMPVGDDVYAKDFMDVLKKKHAAGSYKSMVIYIEACEAGSMFKGLLSTNMNIYATTASNPDESSYGTYCPGDDHNAASASQPDDYGTCLGDLYSISWMEDSDEHDLRKETLKQQYGAVKKRTTNSHVMQYGNLNLSNEFLSTFMGPNPKNDLDARSSVSSLTSRSRKVSQRDASLLYLQHKIKKAPKGSVEEIQAQKRLQNEISHRERVDSSMNHMVELLFGQRKNTENIMNTLQRAGKPLVDDWDCFKKLVRAYEQQCGPLSTYGRKYTGAIANMCNAGVDEQQMDWVSSQACN